MFEAIIIAIILVIPYMIIGLKHHKLREDLDAAISRENNQFQYRVTKVIKKVTTFSPSERTIVEAVNAIQAAAHAAHGIVDITDEEWLTPVIESALLSVPSSDDNDDDDVPVLDEPPLFRGKKPMSLEECAKIDCPLPPEPQWEEEQEKEKPVPPSIEVRTEGDVSKHNED